MKKIKSFFLILFVLITALMFAVIFINAKPKQVELKVEVFERSLPGYKGDDNYWTKWIQKNFGDPNNIKVKFVPVPRSEEINKLNILMASNDAPDIVFTYNYETVYNYVKLGGLTDLTKLVDKHGKNLKKFLGTDVLERGSFEGKQYLIPARRILTGCFGAFIRKDWLDKLGLPVPKTRDELYKTLKAFKEKDPGNVGKDRVIPLALDLNIQNVTWSSRLLIDTFVEPMDFTKEHSTLLWYKPGFKEGIRFLNKMYNEGLISPDFALDKDSKILEKDTAQGRVGFLMQNYDFPYRTSPGLALELKKNVPGGEFVPVDSFANAKGKTRKRMYDPTGLFIMVPKSSKRAVEAIKYLEWMSDPKVMDFLVNGEKGTNYKEYQDGIPINIPIEGEKRLTMDIAIIVNGKDFGNIDKNITALSLGYAPEFKDYIKKAYKQSITADVPYYELSFPIASAAKYAKSILEKDNEIFVKSLTCKPADFDGVFDKLVKEHYDLYAKEVMADRLAYIKKNYKNKK